MQGEPDGEVPLETPDLKTEDTRPEDQTPATSRIATRRLAVWKILVFVWLGTVAFFVSCELIGSNLSRSWADYLGGCALLGLLFGTVAYFVFFGPAALLLTFLLRLTKTSTKAFTACLTLAALAALWILGVTYSESRTASGQVHRFKLITRQELPGQGKLLGWGHGFGLADKRHIWVFEGTPEEFDQFNKALAWKTETRDWHRRRRWTCPGGKSIGAWHCVVTRRSLWVSRHWR